MYVIVHYSASSHRCHQAKLIVQRQGRERSVEQSLSKIMSCYEGFFCVCLCGEISFQINTLLYES